MRFLRLPVILLAALLALAAALPFFTTAAAQSSSLFFEITATTNEPGVMQLFYNRGRGYIEPDSSLLEIKPGSAPQTYRFALPSDPLITLRLDLTNRDGTMFIREPKIISVDGDLVHAFAASALHPLSHIASFTPRNGGYEVVMSPGANDPFVELVFDRPLAPPSRLAHQLASATRPFLITFFAVLIISALPWGRFAPTRVARFTTWAGQHPYKVVALFAMIAVAIQCHPVIFFGKSFVSPNNGTLLYYEGFPTLPNYRSPETEDAKGSDTVAMMCWHLHCPAIAHDALFRDHELPLWNRYTMGGLPLLGQGQSMFGDPLNWLTIVTDSAAWAWDVRFVLSRWLLACGLGLTVFALVRHLPSALLVTLGATFLGFYNFRLNHAANFSLAYAPWVLLAWVHLSQSATWSAHARWCLALIAANFSLMASGTLKEAYMLLLCLNGVGLLLLLGNPISWRQRLTQLGFASASGIALILVSAPLWLVFMATLKKSATNYDTPTVIQVPPTMMIGFFDDLFARQTMPNELIYQPSVNFLIMLGVLWMLATLAHVVRPLVVAILGGMAILCLCLVYGVIPANTIVKIPFIANIAHIHNTFSCPLIILTCVLAGFGFETLWRRLGTSGWTTDFWSFLLLFGALAAVFLSTMQWAPYSAFFAGYGWSLALAVVALPLGLQLARKKNLPALSAAILMAGSVLLLWRHSQYLSTAFDPYVINPQVRTGLQPTSPSIALVNEKMTEPARPLGFGVNLYAGYNPMLGWESILGLDPLRNRQVDELASALGLTRVITHDQPFLEANAAAQLPAFDMMNVRYHLASHAAEPREIAGLKSLARLDLDVFESPTAWPRAFFTNRLWAYTQVSQLAAKVNTGDRRPFAAVIRQDDTLPVGTQFLSGDTAGRTIRAARDYHLTTNRTRFEVEATSAGVIVLSETYYPGDFRVTVNGEPAEYFRVNHTSKGIYVSAPGTYTVEYRYWPEIMNLTLALVALGLGALAVLGWFAWRAPRSLAPETGR